MASLDGSSDYCSRTLQSYVFNLTSSYADQRNEATMVATSVVMFLLAALFFNLSLFSAFSDISAFLIPSVRLFLSASLSLFLPVMSYLFSQAMNNNGGQTTTELSLRARTILTWMLLVELLRKKVEGVLSTEGMQGYSGTIERASRIAWLGYLVFYNITAAGKRAFYGTLWVLAAAKLVQRFVTSELAKRSFAYGKNPRLIASYMAHQMIQEEQNHHQSQHLELLKRCNYVVMGEEELEKKAGPDGYHLELTEEAICRDDSNIVTVGKIWKLADQSDELLHSKPSLKRLCLSFALYKLLRRRLENFPITDAEARNCHGLIFKGLCQEDDGNAAVALFQVFNDEAHFLCEYYHSVVPVMFATPFFFLVNYIMFPLVVGALSVLTIILSSHGDVGYAFSSFRRDNYAITVGVMRIITCLLSKMTRSPTDLFASVDVCITILLALSVAYGHVRELLVFVVSNWFMVSLLCSYAASTMPQHRQNLASGFLRGVIRGILWVRNMMLSQPNVCVKQFSVLWFCRLSFTLPTKAVPEEAKKAIMERLSAATPPSNGRAALEKHRRQWFQSNDDDLSWACIGGVANVMLTWHIATAMLEASHPLHRQKPPGPGRKVAATLSGYCAYLLAFHPELLPEDKDGTERVYKDMKEDLKKEMRCWRYYCSPPGDRCDRLMAIAGRRTAAAEATPTVLRKGARLGKILIDKYQPDTTAPTDERVWELLVDVWTEVLVYAAPTGSDLHVKAHKEALAQGGEFITMLWAIATHTGITRGPASPARV